MSARLVLLSLAAIFLLAPTARAQDYFEQKKKELQLQSQKTVADVTSALAASADLEKKDAAKAKALLEKALDDLANTRGLDNKQYDDLNRKLLDRLGKVEMTLASQKTVGDNNAKQQAEKAAQAEKERLYKELQKSGGKVAYDAVKDRIEGTGKLVDSYKGISATMQKNVNDIALGEAKTFSKMTEERYTEYFRQKSELRLKGKLTPGEVALLKAMNSTMTPNFERTPLKDFLDYMQTKVPGLTIFVDEASLKDLSLDYDAPVTFKTTAKVSVRTIMKKVCADLGLTYVVKDTAVQVITPDRTKDYLVARAYPVQDLIAPWDTRMGPYAGKVQMYQQAQQLMAMIVNMIDPASWEGKSERGYGTIWYNEATMSIIVRHTAEMHYQLGGGLGR